MGIKATPQEIDALIAQTGATETPVGAHRLRDRVELTLPWPLATGNHYKSTTIRYKGTGCNRRPFIHHYVTPEGEEYRRMVADVALREGRPRVEGKVAVRFRIHPPDRRRVDSSNIIKVVEDTLTLAGVIEDDSLIDILHARKRAPRPNGEVYVLIRRIDPQGELF